MMQETNFIEVKNYFENLVAQSNFLKDFTGIFAREFHAKINSADGMESPILAMFKYEKGEDSAGQNTIAVRKLGLSILFNDIASDDIPLQYEKISEAELYADKLIARIRLDSSKKDNVMFNSFLPNTVQILPVEFNGNNFGVDVFFSLKHKQNNAVNLEDWQDLENTCP